MNWMQQIDAYCERTDATFWSEPTNALTNAAFLIAALLMWRRTVGMPLARAMAAVLGAIGVGSFLFHSVATRWAGMADVLPILTFILLYLFAAHCRYWGFGPWWALGATALFLPYAALTGWLFGLIPGLGSSAGYAPVALLILLEAWGLRRRLPKVARGLAIGGALLILSLGFRTLDMPLCPRVPLGTHFMWHILNAILLAWMIEVYRRHIEDRARQAPVTR